jgi:hypothetical protein
MSKTTAATSQFRSVVEKAYPFEVVKLPLHGPDNLQTPHFGLFRDDRTENASVGVAVSNRYEPHTRDDICALVEASEQAFDGTIKPRCAWRDGHIITVTPSDSYRRQVYRSDQRDNGGDNVWPRLIIRAGYDAQAFTCSLGFYRDVCINLSMFQSVGGVYRKLRHLNSLRDRMPELINDISEVAGQWDGVVETIHAMQQREINLADFVRTVYPPPSEDAKKGAQTRYENRVAAIFRRVSRERQQLGRPSISEGAGWLVNGWEAFNGVQGYVQHDHTRHGKADRFDRMLLALNDKHVTQAEALVLAG